MDWYRDLTIALALVGVVALTMISFLTVLILAAISMCIYIMRDWLRDDSEFGGAKVTKTWLDRNVESDVVG